MKLLYRLIVIFSFIFILTAIIAFARGYRIDLQRQSLTPTGILAISAYPKAAKVYINGVLKGVTDINLTLPPAAYEVEVKKAGYTSWKKTVSLKGELVLSLDVLLYPLNPSLSPLTNLSVSRAFPIAQTYKVLLFSEQGDELKDGIYLFEPGAGPISFFTPLKLIALKKNLSTSLGNFSFNEAEVEVSPDAKEAIFSFETSFVPASYLLSLDPPSGEEDTSFFDISSSRETLTQAWSKQKEEVNRKILEAYPKEIAKVASDSFHVIEFSPDETKLLYLAKRSTTLPQAVQPPLIAVNQTPENRNIAVNSSYVYDKKEDRNYKIDLINLIDLISNQNKKTLGQLNQLEIRNFINWYSDSKHLVINEGKKISFIDYDNQNKQTVYSGDFDNSFFKVTNDGKILILTNLNPESNKFPDLYAVGIR